eukprot:7193392-Prymnesium_polylepis.1
MLVGCSSAAAGAAPADERRRLKGAVSRPATAGAPKGALRRLVLGGAASLRLKNGVGSERRRVRSIKITTSCESQRGAVGLQP